MSIKNLRGQVLLALSIISYFFSYGQEPADYFGDRCTGTWEGTMYLSEGGKIKDSLTVTFEVKKKEEAKAWTWRTTYSGRPEKIVKDYVLKLVDASSGSYVIDEGDGILLNCYLFGQRLFSTFSVGDNLLTANYQLSKDGLYFEVTSSRREESTGDGSIYNYSVLHVQNVLLTRS